MPNTCAAIVIAAKHSELIKVKDASGVTNTIGALRCKFEFRTADWDKSARTAVFCKGNMATHPNIIETAISVPLDSVDECAVPWEVLVPDAKYFSVGLWGITDTGLRVVSKWLVFRVVDGCYVDSAEPADPTPTVYEQIMLALNSKAPVDHNHDDIYYTKEEIDSAKILAEDVLYSYDSDLDITNTKEALDGIISEVFNLMTSDGEVKEELKNKESISNKTTEIAEISTDNQYPSAKAVYDFVNQSEHITKLTATNTYIWDLPAGIYTFTATNKVQKIYLSMNYNYPCDEGAFLIVGGENHSGYLPSATTFKKSVIFLRNLNATMAQIITGISTVNYTTAEDGKVTYIVEWDGGIIESQDNKTNVVDESVTNDQYPSAKAVYDYGANIEKYSKNHLSNAFKKSASAVTNLEINDVSPIAHDIVCSLNSNNLLPITKINEDVNSMEIPLGKTLPAGKYLLTLNAEKSMRVEFYDETDFNFQTSQSSVEEVFLTVSSPFNKIIIRIDNGTLKDCCPALYLDNFSIVTVTINNQDIYTPSVQGVVTGIQSVDGDTNMTISTDIDGIEINVEYNADINQAIPSLENVELSDNKIQDIIANKMNSEKYPSAKAVYEYGQSLQMSGGGGDEGAISMVGENYIEVKDNVIRTTFGDPAKIVEEEPTRQYCDENIGILEYNTDNGMYCSSYHGLGTSVIPPNNGEILEIKLTDSSGNIIFDGEAIYQGDSTGGRADCQDKSRIVFSDMYASTGGLDIVVMWTTDISNAHLKMTGKKQIVIDGYVTLPKTALNYDNKPIEDSDNLLTSGVVHIAIQTLQNQIAAIPKTEILTSEEQDFSDESVLSSALTIELFSRIDERLSGIETNVSTTLSDYSLASDLIGGAE